MNLPGVFPGYWAMAWLIARRGTDGLASRNVPCGSLKDSQKKEKAFKTKLNFYMLSQRPELHAGM